MFCLVNGGLPTSCNLSVVRCTADKQTSIAACVKVEDCGCCGQDLEISTTFFSHSMPVLLGDIY